MSGATLATLNKILKEAYMGPPKFWVEGVTRWTCSKHKKPKLDQYEEVCQYAEKTGEECPNKWECPHVISRKVKDGCPECKTSEYEPVLDADTFVLYNNDFTAMPAYRVRFGTTMQWELSRSSYGFLTGVLDGPTVTIPLKEDDADGKQA